MAAGSADVHSSAVRTQGCCARRGMQHGGTILQASGFGPHGHSLTQACRSLPPIRAIWHLVAICSNYIGPQDLPSPARALHSDWPVTHRCLGHPWPAITIRGWNAQMCILVLDASVGLDGRSPSFILDCVIRAGRLIALSMWSHEPYWSLSRCSRVSWATTRASLCDGADRGTPRARSTSMDNNGQLPPASRRCFAERPGILNPERILTLAG